MNECLDEYLLSNEIAPQKVSVSSDGEIVSLCGCLSTRNLLYNPSYGAHEVLQLEKNLYPEKDLYFVTLSTDNRLRHLLLLSHGRLLLTDWDSSYPETGLNLSVSYSRAFGMRITLIDYWLPLSVEYRYPSAYKTGDLVVLSGVMTGREDPSSDDRPFGILPLGYRPNHRQVFAVATRSGKARVDILPNGWCHVYAPDRKFVSLEGIQYLAHTPLPPIRRLLDYCRDSLKIEHQDYDNYGKGYPPLEVIVYFGWVMLNGLIRRTHGRNWREWETIARVPERFCPPSQLVFHSDDFHLSDRLRPIVVRATGEILVKRLPGTRTLSLSNTFWQSRFKD
jgi:hypothetical protein